MRFTVHACQGGALVLCSLLTLTPLSARAARNQSPPVDLVLTGWVEDATGRLPGADVHIVELGRQVVTDAQGAFTFRSLPRGTFTLGVHLQGYADVHRSVNVPGTGPVVVRLEFGWRVAEEVTVTAAPWAVTPRDAAQPVELVDAEDVRRQGVASIGDALDRVPGVANISTGAALGTPVIRGISENRVRVLNDGVPLNYQQFSSRHSPNVDPGLAERIEVVRGPASVLYGPEAMAGVVNVVQAPLPTAHDTPPSVHGQASVGYGGNTSEWHGQFQAEGASGGLGWRGAVVRRSADDIRTPSGTLRNTGFDQTNASAAVGYSGDWGRGRVRWHHWSDDHRFHRPEAFRLDLVDDLLAADAFVPTAAGDVELRGSWQRNVRQAYPGHLGGRAAEDLLLTTAVARAALAHAPTSRLRGRAALDYQQVQNRQRITGVLLPDYTSRTVALMGYEELRAWPGAAAGSDRVILSAGLRWDTQRLDVPPDETRDLPNGFRQHYRALSGSLGAVVRPLGDWSVTASLGRGWRAPNAFELFANGVHGGVAAVQKGNPDLETEANLQLEASLRYDGRSARAAVAFYRNAIDRFIYLADTGELVELPEGVLPVFAYRQADALLRGLEVSTEVVPRNWVTLSGVYSHVTTENLASGRRLPQAPADRVVVSAVVRRQACRRWLAPYLGIDLVGVGRGRVSGPDEPFGTPTAPYAILNARCGVATPVGGALLSLDVYVQNLLNTEYTDFLWTYKPWGPNPGRDVRALARVTF